MVDPSEGQSLMEKMLEEGCKPRALTPSALIHKDFFGGGSKYRLARKMSSKARRKSLARRKRKRKGE